MIKKLFALLLALALLLCGCTAKAPETQPTETAAPKEKPRSVGICLPDFSWSEQADRLCALLEEAGCQVYLEYASSDVQLQQSQVQTLVNMPVGCLLVAAIDSMSLVDVLAAAREDQVPVIALDRMLTYTDAVVGCVAVDHYEAGRLLGSHIVAEKKLETAQKPVTIEFFMGAPENHSSLLLYQGVMEQLRPYLQSGILQCRSGRTAFEDTCIQEETTEAASDRCFDYITEFYTDKAPDVLCAATDPLAAGCISALFSFGMGPKDEDWSLVVSSGGTQDGIANILQYYQSITLYADPEVLADQCVQWALAAIDGTLPTGQTMFNGVSEVSTFLLKPIVIGLDNYKDAYKEDPAEES